MKMHDKKTQEEIDNYKVGFFERIENILKHFRRQFYIRFRKKYVENQVKKRKGQCNHCTCEPTLFTPCPHYNEKTKLCQLWVDKGREAIPYACQVSPFDETDKIRFQKKFCGWYWDD